MPRYVSEFDAVVTEITDDGGVVLDRSAFYIGGGGQPCDVGTLTDTYASGVSEYKVTKVGRAGGGEFWHRALYRRRGAVVKPAVGAALHGAIDWDRRYLLMRTHTALHGGSMWRGVAGLRGAGDGWRHAARDGADGFRAGEYVGGIRRGGGGPHQRRG